MYDQVTLPFIAVSHHLKFIYQKMPNFCMPTGIFVFTKPVNGNIIPSFLYAIKVCFVPAAFKYANYNTVFIEDSMTISSCNKLLQKICYFSLVTTKIEGLHMM